MKKHYTFNLQVWLWPSETAAWHFVTIPKEESEIWRQKFKGLHWGWNSIRAKITLGKTVWDTSVFFSASSKRYILPLKAKVRKAENIFEGDKVKLKLQIL